MSDWNSMLDGFEKCGARLKAALESESEGDLNLSLEKNSWSILQIIHHLADAALIWSMFIRQALGDSGGEFNLGWYWSRTQDEWSEIWNYSGRDLSSSLLIYQSSNQSNVDLLRSVNHTRENFLLLNFPGKESQTFTVEDVVNWQAIHLDEHLDEIYDILQLHRKAE